MKMTVTASQPGRDGWMYWQLKNNVQIRARLTDLAEIEIDLPNTEGQIASAIASSWQARMVQDLDRCPHGRHEGDPCAGWIGPGMFTGGCYGGVSAGNPDLQTLKVLGYTIRGSAYIVPPPGRRGDADAWTPTE